MSDDRIEQYEDECAALAAEEEAFLADSIPAIDETETGEPSADFVEQCLHNNELGDGTLYRRIHRNKFILVKTRGANPWLRWAGHHWEIDLMGAHISVVSDVAQVYLDQSAKFDEPLREARLKQSAASAEMKQAHDQGDNAKAAQLAGDVDQHDREIKRLQGTRQKLLDRVRRLKSKGGAEKCTWWAHHIKDPLAINGREIDQKPMLLAAPNCVIDMVSGRPRDGRPEDYLLRSIPVDYPTHLDQRQIDRYLIDGKGDLTKPVDDFFASIMRPVQAPRDLGDICEPDWEIVRYLQSAAGYSLTGHALEQYIHICNGDGANAKGVMFREIQSTAGEYYWTIQSELLLESKNQRNTAGASPDILALRGRRFVVASETDPHRKISAARVKEYTGSDTLNARGLFDSDETNFNPSHTLWLQTNNIPTGLTKEFSLRRRVVLIDFPWRFVDDPTAMALKYPENAPWYRPIDRTIGDKLARNRHLFLLWLLRGCILWQQAGGLKPPTQLQHHLESLEIEEDPLEQFLRGCCLREWSPIITYRHGDDVSRNGQHFVSALPDRDRQGQNLNLDPDTTAGRDAWEHKGPGLDPHAPFTFSTFYDAYIDWYRVTVTDKKEHMPSRKSVGTEMRRKGFTVPPASETGGTTKIFGGIRILRHVGGQQYDQA